jgi:hypothetical protein
MAQPIVLVKAVRGVIKTRLSVAMKMLEENEEFNLDQATQLAFVLNSVFTSVAHAIKRVTTPQNDGVAMPNDTHGPGSRG